MNDSIGSCGESKLDGVFMSMSDHAFSAGKQGEIRLFEGLVLLNAMNDGASSWK